MPLSSQIEALVCQSSKRKRKQKVLFEALIFYGSGRIELKKLTERGVYLAGF